MEQTMLAALFSNGGGIVHHFGGGVYAKETRIPAGVKLTQHRHTFDHLSILAVGRVVVAVDGQQKTFDGPACIEIKAGKAHEVTALTDATWFCVHATSETDHEKVDHELIAHEDQIA